MNSLKYIRAIRLEQRAEIWMALATKALSTADRFASVQQWDTAHRYLSVSRYCCERLDKITNEIMLTKKQDTISSIIGAIFCAFIFGLLIFLIHLII